MRPIGSGIAKAARVKLRGVTKADALGPLSPQQAKTIHAPSLTVGLGPSPKVPSQKGASALADDRAAAAAALGGLSKALHTLLASAPVGPRPASLDPEAVALGLAELLLNSGETATALLGRLNQAIDKLELCASDPDAPQALVASRAQLLSQLSAAAQATPTPPEAEPSAALREAVTRLLKRTVDETSLGHVSLAPVSPAALEQAAKSRAAEVPAFARMAQEAEARGLEIFVLGGAATSFAAHVKAGLAAEAGDVRLRQEWVSSNELDAFLNLTTQDLDLVVSRADGKPESLAEIEAIEAALRAEIPGVDIDVRGYRTPKDEIHHPLTAGSSFFDEHHNSMDYLALRLSGTGPALVDLAEQAGLSGQSAVADLAAGQIRLALSDKHNSTPTGHTGDSPAVKHAVRALIKAVRHGLEPDEPAKDQMKALFSGWVPSTSTSDVVGRWMGRNLKKLITDAMDLPSAFRLLDEVGALPGLRAMADPELSALFNRRPLVVEAPHPVPGAGTAASLGLDRLWHVTDSYESYVAMTRTPLRRPNMFASTGSAGTAANYGAGAYFTIAGEVWGGNSGAAKRAHVVEVRLSPEAKEGVDFRRVVSDSGQTFVVVMNRDCLSLDQKPIHQLSLDQALEVLFSAGTAQQLHLLRQLIERFTALAAAPGVRAQLEAKLLAAIQAQPPEGLEGMLPLFEDPKLRALAPKVAGALVDRALAAGDALLGLRVIEAQTDEKTLRSFAKKVLPLVPEASGYFLNTFGQRLFGMFEPCPDALGPILALVGEPARMIEYGLMHGAPAYSDILAPLAKGCTGQERSYLSSLLPEQGFSALAKALAG